VTPLRFGRMLELGNKKSHVPYKDFFEDLGFLHTSVDLNGLDGALKLDLEQPLELGVFEMVTNIGTSEHVGNQQGVWRNIVEALDHEAVLCCVTPAPNNWRWHGRFYPTMEFYRALCDLNGLVLDRLHIDGVPDRKNLYCRAHRVEQVPFVMPPAELLWVNEQGKKVGEYKS